MLLQACMWAGEFKTPSDPERMHGIAFYFPLFSLFSLVAPHFNAIQGLVEDGEVTEREREHIRAALAFSKGSLPQACLHWSNIIVKYPLGRYCVWFLLTTIRHFSLITDAHAIKWLFDAGITLGEYDKMRDVLSSVVVHWNSSMVLYPYILAL